MKKEEISFKDTKNFDDKDGSILGVLEGPIADFMNPTRNGRLYTEELWEKVYKNPLVQEQFKNGGIPGELDHPTDRDEICSEKIAVLMSEPPVKKDGKYWGKFNILNTPCGKIVYTLAKAGFKLGVSSRGNGDVDDYTNTVDPDSYDFTCFDVVLIPAVKSARMNLIEGLDKQKAKFNALIKEELESSSKEDKILMESTLKNLNLLEEKEDKHICAICGNEFEGVGNNAEPLVKNGICCDKCNISLVVPERLKEINKYTESLKLVESVDKVEKDDEFEVVETGDEVKTEVEGEEEKPVMSAEVFIDTISDIADLTADELQGLVFKIEDGAIVQVKDEEPSEENGEEITKDETIDVTKDETIQNDSEIVGNTEIEDEMIEEFQRVLKDNVSLRKKIESLQSEKAVSNTKVDELNESVNGLTERNNILETERDGLFNKVKELKESLNKKQTQIELQESRIQKLSDSKNKALELNESYNSKNTEIEKELSKTKNQLASATRKAEELKKLAESLAERYIKSKAVSLGVTTNEIRNRLNESYTLDDVDKVCQDLQDYSLSISRLPFEVTKPDSNVIVKLREDHSKNPIRNVLERGKDDVVDDYTMDLVSGICQKYTEN